MKLTYTARNGRVTIEADVATEKEAFEKLASFEEILEEPQCGACGSEAIRHDVRIVDDNKFFHLVCRACSARLDFGQTKKGDHLFAKRKGEDKQRLPRAGWYIYQGDQAPAIAAAAVTTLPASAAPDTLSDADPCLRSIAAASTRKELETVGGQIKSAIAAGNVSRAQQQAYRERYDARLKELTIGRGR